MKIMSTICGRKPWMLIQLVSSFTCSFRRVLITFLVGQHCHTYYETSVSDFKQLVKAFDNPVSLFRKQLVSKIHLSSTHHAFNPSLVGDFVGRLLSFVTAVPTIKLSTCSSFLVHCLAICPPLLQLKHLRLSFLPLLPSVFFFSKQSAAL
jgi:hypothetical protein